MSISSYNEKRDNSGLHYCDLCKCWVSNNKYNLAMHEKTERHKAAVERRMREMKQNDMKQDQLLRDLEAMKRVCFLFLLHYASYFLHSEHHILHRKKTQIQ